jgi:hypothetical protein
MFAKSRPPCTLPAPTVEGRRWRAGWRLDCMQDETGW